MCSFSKSLWTGAFFRSSADATAVERFQKSFFGQIGAHNKTEVKFHFLAASHLEHPWQQHCGSSLQTGWPNPRNHWERGIANQEFSDARSAISPPDERRPLNFFAGNVTHIWTSVVVLTILKKRSYTDALVGSTANPGTKEGAWKDDSTQMAAFLFSPYFLSRAKLMEKIHSQGQLDIAVLLQTVQDTAWDTGAPGERCQSPIGPISFSNSAWLIKIFGLHSKTRGHNCMHWWHMDRASLPLRRRRALWYHLGYRDAR